MKEPVVVVPPGPFVVTPFVVAPLGPEVIAVPPWLVVPTLGPEVIIPSVVVVLGTYDLVVV